MASRNFGKLSFKTEIKVNNWNLPKSAYLSNDKNPFKFIMKYLLLVNTWNVIYCVPVLFNKSSTKFVTLNMIISGIEFYPSHPAKAAVPIPTTASSSLSPFRRLSLLCGGGGGGGGLFAWFLLFRLIWKPSSSLSSLSRILFVVVSSPIFLLRNYQKYKIGLAQTILHKEMQ